MSDSITDLSGFTASDHELLVFPRSSSCWFAYKQALMERCIHYLLEHYQHCKS